LLRGGASRAMVYGVLIKRPTVATTCLALVIATTLSGCSGGDEPALPDVPVSLAFTGQVQGTMTSAINVHAHTDDDPMPELTQVNGQFVEHALTKTQCANFTVNGGSVAGYLGNVYGDVGGQKLALTIEFDPDSAAYENPGTRADPWANSMSGAHAELYLPGEDGPRMDVVGPPGSGVPDQSLVLNQDRRSGRIDAWFGSGGRSTQDAGNVGVIHVVGDWRCS
jgi:hypothetical protein